MSKEMAVAALGIWVIVIPYLGVPGSWRTVLLVATGAALVVLGLFLRATVLSSGRERRSDLFVENSHSSTQEAGGAHEHKDGITSLN